MANSNDFRDAFSKFVRQVNDLADTFDLAAARLYGSGNVTDAEFQELDKNLRNFEDSANYILEFIEKHLNNL